MKKVVLVSVAFLLVMSGVIMVTPASVEAATAAPDVIDTGDSGGGQLLQFTAGGHVLGFDSRGVYLAGLDHALRVEFAGGIPVRPAAQAGGAAQNGAAPLGTVTYSGVWSNIDVIYSAVDGGIAESAYVIHPGGNPADIGLRYNVPVEVMPDGGLGFSFDSGHMTESAPVAWQNIGGERLPVAVQFRLQAEDHVGFTLGGYDAAHTVYIDPTYQWHTFYGSSSDDYCWKIAVDSLSNVYVAGGSYDTWGTPLNAFNGSNSYDIVVVKLNGSGARQWHTFYGSSSGDYARSIVTDTSGNVYVAGYSYETWNGPGDTSPLNPHAGGTGHWDIAVVKLDGSGAYQWHTFHGSSNVDEGYGIASDPSGNVYVTGYSTATWNGPGSIPPLNAYAGIEDIVVVKLNSSGAYQWHTFHGSSGYDAGYITALDSSGNVYVSAVSGATWNGPGSIPPINSHAGNYDIVVVKLNGSGAYQWHTFYGSSNVDYGSDMAVDPSGNVYVAGISTATWNGPGSTSPLNAYVGGWDIVVVKLNGSGAYLWHTFYGSSSEDRGYGMVMDSSGSVYVSGYSYATWNGPGSIPPINSHAGNYDIVVVKLNGSGAYKWHTFYGSSSGDECYSIAADSSSNIYVTGKSNATWGTPINGHAGSYDIVVIKTADPPPTSTPTPTPSPSPSPSQSPSPSPSPTSSPTPTSVPNPGDVNNDGRINCLDITQCELCILYPGLYPKENYPGWDANEDNEGPNAGDILAVELRILAMWPPP